MLRPSSVSIQCADMCIHESHDVIHESGAIAVCFKEKQKQEPIFKVHATVYCFPSFFVGVQVCLSVATSVQC